MFENQRCSCQSPGGPDVFLRDRLAFGADVVGKFLQKHDFDLVVRAHQVVEDGYEFFADRQLVTIFSAPNYCGEFDNAGAVRSLPLELNVLRICVVSK